MAEVLENRQAMVAEEEEPQQRGKPRKLKTTCWCIAHLPALLHTEPEKAPASENREDCVSGESCFLEVLSEHGA
jgi:hypothetical protein